MKTESILTDEVRALVDEVKQTHRYSMSRIYGLYNRVFEKNEAPQSCASCLIRKVRELTVWLENENKAKVQKLEKPKEKKKSCQKKKAE